MRIGQTIDQLQPITKNELANDDALPVRDASISRSLPTATKYLSIGELRNLITEAAAAASLSDVMRSGSSSLLANDPTQITFSEPFSASYFFLVKYGEDADGNYIPVRITGSDADGFVATALEACTFNYLVMVAV